MTFQFLNHENVLTKFCFLFGKNLSFSPSPKLHNFWFKKYGLNIEYKKYVIQTHHEFISALHLFNNDQKFFGANITMPFKQGVLEVCEDLIICSETVKNSASANTLFRDQDGFLHAENTDIIGIKNTISTLCPSKNGFDKAIIYGGGGAAVSCIFTLFEYGVTNHVICMTRNLDLSMTRFCKSAFLQKQMEMKRLTFKNFSENDELSNEQLEMHHKSKKTILVINTLPLGKTSMYPESNTLCIDLLVASNPEHTFYFDLVYDYTDACACAQKLGIRYYDGQQMLKIQAAASFKLWTGIDVND